jgi:hypothetical protein
MDLKKIIAMLDQNLEWGYSCYGGFSIILDDYHFCLAPSVGSNMANLNVWYGNTHLHEFKNNTGLGDLYLKLQEEYKTKQEQTKVAASKAFEKFVEDYVCGSR